MTTPQPYPDPPKVQQQHAARVPTCFAYQVYISDIIDTLQYMTTSMGQPTPWPMIVRGCGTFLTSRFLLISIRPIHRHGLGDL
jgi:hypothetical protein